MNNNTNQQDLTYNDVISKDIFELMGAKTLSEEKKKELYQKIIDVVQRRTIKFIADNLNNADMEEWKKFKEPKEKAEFLKKKKIDVEKIMLQQSLIYKTELIELSKIAQGGKE